MLKKFDFSRFLKRRRLTTHYQPKVSSIETHEILFRQATIEDIKDLLAVERLVYNGQTPWGKSAFYRELLSKQKHLYLVAVNNKKIVAFAGIRLFLDNGHLTNVAVVPDFQNLSIGRKLIKELENFAQKEDCRTLSLEVRRSNLDAQRFYRLMGFEAVRVKPNYYNEFSEDAIDMVKKYDD